MEKFTKNILFYIIVIAAAAYGLWYAWDIRWACDDIFITLRYISNWFDGKGIVYNEGEYVEGYTHFLWLLLVAAAGKLGFDMMNASLWLGLISFVAVIFLSAWRARKIGFFLPIVAIYICFHHDMAVWATGGLETMLYAFLIFAAFSIRFQSDLSHNIKLLFTGFICALAVLTRPDAALLLIWICAQEFIVSIFQKVSIKNIITNLFYLAIIPILLLAPWIIWKYNYYGDILPNTYYAKSGGLSYFSQGWDYLDSYARGYVSVYAALLIGLVGIVVGFTKRKNIIFHTEIPLYFQSLSVILFVILYAVFFVAKSGGDYMYARFIIPIVPLYLIPVENTFLLLKEYVSARKFIVANVVLLIAFTSFSFAEHEFRDSLFRTPGHHTKLTEKWKAKIYESHIYHKYSYPTDKYRKIGEELKPIFAGTNARVLNFGDCCMCYYANFDFVLENFGLTDSYIAHKPLTERVTMVGHEKTAEPEYLAKRDIQLCINGPDFSGRNFTKFRFVTSSNDTIKGDMLYYNMQVMNSIKKNAGDKIIFTNPYEWFEELIAKHDPNGTDSLKTQYQLNIDYYFNPNRNNEAVFKQEEEIKMLISSRE